VLSLDGTLLDVNATALEGVAVNREAVIGKPLEKRSGSPALPECQKWCTTRFLVSPMEKPRARKSSINLPAGGWRWYDFQMRPVHDEDGVVALVAEAGELTARCKAEESLRRAQKMEAIDQLTGCLAHDFNNLLQIEVDPEI
jgi:PAS fold